MHSMVLQKSIKDKLITLDCDMISPDIPAFTDLPCKDSNDIIDYASRNEYFIDMDETIRKNKNEVDKNEVDKNKIDKNEIDKNETKIDKNQENQQNKETNQIICNEDVCNVKNTFFSYWFVKKV